MCVLRYFVPKGVFFNRGGGGRVLNPVLFFWIAHHMKKNDDSPLSEVGIFSRTFYVKWVILKAQKFGRKIPSSYTSYGYLVCGVA